MATGSPHIEPVHGYLSEDSKRRFTLVAGMLGAAFFVAQFLLPMLVMFMVMMPMMMRQVSIADLDQAVLWHYELWFVERTTKVNWSDPGKSASAQTLKHVQLADLSEALPSVPLDATGTDSTETLLPVGDRLWVIGADKVSYYEGGSLTRLGGAKRPPRAGRPFVYRGRPAVISVGTHPSLATLQAEGRRAEWTSQEFPLGLPSESGSLRTLQAVEARGGLYLFAALCTEEPERCSLSYREPEHDQWLPLVEDACSCLSWTAVALGSRPAVVLSEQETGRAKRHHGPLRSLRRDPQAGGHRAGGKAVWHGPVGGRSRWKTVSFSSRRGCRAA